MSRTERSEIPNFLCDTWWYGLTQRLNDDTFEKLVKLRSKQGFSAVQLVVGIPPEVGPENQNAASRVGPAWNLKGELNDKYLDHAREKIQMLNSYGLTVIVYGAWGQQVEWLGVERMKDWWKEVIHKIDDLDVMYCLTGESDIWVGEERKLLPDKTTGELNTVRMLPFLHPRLVYLGKRLIRMVGDSLNESKKEERREKWSEVLTSVSAATKKPIFIHTLPGRTSEEVVNNPELLDAITVQTGHDASTRKILWQLPLESARSYPNKPFINLEPWYEGITGRFGTNDQLYAYWASMMAGAHAYCYGAHGIWNVGDGEFLAHWGTQTIEGAMKLNTPRLVGKSHNLFIESRFMDYGKVEVEDRDGEMIKITRIDGEGNSVCYIPEVSQATEIPQGRVFLPLRGVFAKSVPHDGQVVITSNH
jgi:hypothetical protein